MRNRIGLWAISALAVGSAIGQTITSTNSKESLNPPPMSASPTGNKDEAPTPPLQMPTPSTLPALMAGPASVQEIQTPSPTSFPAAGGSAISLRSDYTQPPVAGESPVPSGQLGKVIVTTDLDQARDEIAPSLGASRYTIGPDQIQNTPGGENATIQQVLLRAPSVVLDSFGQEHVRGEHANITYRINGVLLPQPLNGFGQEIDTHLIDSVTLIDGSLPAQFGFHTAGIIDVTTKSGTALHSNELSLYGGSYNTYNPSLQFGGSLGKWDYFFTGSYLSNNRGIENPTPKVRPVHDETSQYRGFGYLAYHIDDTSRVSFIANGSYADFELPNTKGLASGFTAANTSAFDSRSLNENQNEQEYYSLVSYQKTMDKLSMQLSAFSRYALVDFRPDRVGDLVLQGVSGSLHNSFITQGVQYDASYVLNDQHTIRGGFIADYTLERQDSRTSVFALDSAGLQLSDTPLSINDSDKNTATESGFYLQDEWSVTPKLTINYGARYDRFDSSFDREDQLSPRINFVYKLDSATHLHAGYSRFFVTPPIQSVRPTTLNKFVGTTNEPELFAANAPRSERSNYYDLGISHTFGEVLVVNVDGFYKESRQLIDLGQFGDAVILAPFNYRRGAVYGGEVSSTYKQGPLSLFGNVAYIQTRAIDADTQQFEFEADELAYIQTHNVHLDHQAEWTASAGVAYQLTRDDLLSADILYGSGLRSGFANTDSEPSYYPVNLGYQHVFHIQGSSDNAIRFRIDLVNVFDQRYQIRDGNGIGTSSAQYGQRRSIYAGVAYEF